VCLHDSLKAFVLTIENAWLSYRSRRIFKLLKHAVRAAVSNIEISLLCQIILLHYTHYALLKVKVQEGRTPKEHRRGAHLPFMGC